MRKLLIATRSNDKLKEVEAGLRGISFKILSLHDLKEIGDYDVEEPAETFEGNAIIKAIMYGKKSGLLALADDSGLEVDALGGNPGVLTKRYAQGSDEDRFKKILQELAGVPDGQRGAKFRCVIAIYDPKLDKVRTCEDVYRGVIAHKAKGGQGFGYDPIFYNMELKKMNAEMTLTEKNSVSHRGKALRKAKKLLEYEFYESI